MAVLSPCDVRGPSGTPQPSPVHLGFCLQGTVVALAFLAPEHLSSKVVLAGGEKAVAVTLNVAPETGGAEGGEGESWARSSSPQTCFQSCHLRSPCDQGCRSHCHRGPHQACGCLQRAEGNYGTV